MSQDEKEVLLQKFADVSHRLNLANIQLEEANKKLKEYEEKALQAEKASKMKSLFLANMSHEIRTPLNAIEGFSRVMVEAESLQERMSYMEIIESNNRRLLSLVNEILDLSRVEAGEISIKKTNVDLNYMLTGIKQLFKFRCPDTIELTGNMPTVQVMMTTDEDKLTQVFSNLISNALKHTTASISSMTIRTLSSTLPTLAQALSRSLLTRFSMPMLLRMLSRTRAMVWDYRFVRLSLRRWGAIWM